MTTRTFRALAFALMVTAVLFSGGSPAPAEDAFPRDRVCDLRASWVGEFGGSTLTATYHGSFGRGTVALEFIDFDPVLALGLPPSTLSGARGAWRRTGARTFDYANVSYGVSADNQILYILKLSGPKTMSEDCQSFEAVGFLEIFAPGQDPFGDEEPAISGGIIPGGVIPVGVATAKRMTADRADE